MSHDAAKGMERLRMWLLGTEELPSCRMPRRVKEMWMVAARETMGCKRMHC